MKTKSLTSAALVSFVLLGSPALAQDGAMGAASPNGLQALDWVIIAIYALSTIGLGVYFSRQQQTTQEYFVGGGNLNPIFVGISLFATLLSTISYLSRPGEACGKGPVTALGMLALPLVYLVVAKGMLPTYMRQRATSAYELLEAKLGLGIRLLGASMFLTLRLVWMTLLVYLAAKALSVMMGVHPRWIPLIVLFTGMVSVIYTSLGGLRAVVVTDFLQTILLFGGALLVIATVTWQFHGFGWFPTEWQPNWDRQPFFSFDPRTRVTVVGSILTILAWYVATSGGDQTSVQRFMATRDASAASRALATQLIVATAVGLTLSVVGFALLGYFKLHGDQLPAGMTIANSADDLFPRYIAFHLPVGVSGLVVSAMFAAAMSSIDSGVNSITAVVVTDFLGRFGKGPKTEKAMVRFAQVVAFVIGATVVLGSSFMRFIPGNITAQTNKTVNLLTTPIFGLFFFALFIPFARPLGVWLGTICGTTTAALIAFSGPVVAKLAQWGVDPATFGVELITKTDPVTGRLWTTAQDPISFQWIGPVALLVNIAVGTAVSWVLSRKDSTRNQSSA